MSAIKIRSKSSFKSKSIFSIFNLLTPILPSNKFNIKMLDGGKVIYIPKQKYNAISENGKFRIFLVGEEDGKVFIAKLNKNNEVVDIEVMPRALLYGDVKSRVSIIP